MSNLKVGDKVKIVDHVDDEDYVFRGMNATILEVRGSDSRNMTLYITNELMCEDEEGEPRYQDTWLANELQLIGPDINPIKKLLYN